MKRKTYQTQFESEKKLTRSDCEFELMDGIACAGLTNEIKIGEECMSYCVDHKLEILQKLFRLLFSNHLIIMGNNGILGTERVIEGELEDGTEFVIAPDYVVINSEIESLERFGDIFNLISFDKGWLFMKLIIYMDEPVKHIYFEFEEETIPLRFRQLSDSCEIMLEEFGSSDIDLSLEDLQI